MSLLGPAVAWLVENKGWTRINASVWCGFATWLVGLGTLLSFDEWSGYTLWVKTFFDLLDFVTSNIMLPLGGLFIAVFAAWVMKSSSTADELTLEENGPAFTVWRFLLRFVTPVAVIIVFLNAIGLL